MLKNIYIGLFILSFGFSTQANAGIIPHYYFQQQVCEYDSFINHMHWQFCRSSKLRSKHSSVCNHLASERRSTDRANQFLGNGQSIKALCNGYKRSGNFAEKNAAKHGVKQGKKRRSQAKSSAQKASRSGGTKALNVQLIKQIDRHIKAIW